MAGTKQLKWETIANGTERLPVYGGWLIRVAGMHSLKLIHDNAHFWKLPEADLMEPKGPCHDCGH